MKQLMNQEIHLQQTQRQLRNEDLAKAYRQKYQKQILQNCLITLTLFKNHYSHTILVNDL